MRRSLFRVVVQIHLCQENLVLLYYASQRFNLRDPFGFHASQEFQPFCFQQFNKFNEFKMSLLRVLEINMRALQQTLNMAHDIKLIQGFEG